MTKKVLFDISVSTFIERHVVCYNGPKKNKLAGDLIAIKF